MGDTARSRLIGRDVVSRWVYRLVVVPVAWCWKLLPSHRFPLPDDRRETYWVSRKS